MDNGFPGPDLSLVIILALVALITIGHTWRINKEKIDE